MIHPETHVVTLERGPAPAGKPGECVYCRQAIGLEHSPGCVMRQRTVVVETRVRYVVAVPEDWTGEQIEYHRNESSRCASGVVDDLVDAVDRAKRAADDANGVPEEAREMGGWCPCDLVVTRYVCEASAEDEAAVVVGPGIDGAAVGCSDGREAAALLEDVVTFLHGCSSLAERFGDGLGWVPLRATALWQRLKAAVGVGQGPADPVVDDAPVDPGQATDDPPLLSTPTTSPADWVEVRLVGVRSGTGQRGAILRGEVNVDDLLGTKSVEVEIGALTCSQCGKQGDFNRQAAETRRCRKCSGGVVLIPGSGRVQ